MKIIIPEEIRNFIAPRDEKEEVSVICDAERCGVLLGCREGNRIIVREIVETRNSSNRPTEFEIDPNELYKIWLEAEKKGLEIVAVFHTHPFGLAVPSGRDIEGLKQTKMIWVIVGIDGVRAYIYRDKVEEIEVELKS